MLSMASNTEHFRFDTSSIAARMMNTSLAKRFGDMIVSNLVKESIGCARINAIKSKLSHFVCRISCKIIREIMVPGLMLRNKISQ